MKPSCSNTLLICSLGVATCTQTVYGWTYYCSSRHWSIISPAAPRAISKLCSSFDDDDDEEMMMNPLFSMDPNEMFPNNFDDKDDKDGDDDGSIVDNPGSLQQILRGADNTVWGASARNNNRRLDIDTIAKLQEIAQQELLQQQREQQQNSNRDPDDEMSKLEYREIKGVGDDDDDDDDEDEMSHFLSEDDYMQASRSINPDGSLPTYIFSEGMDRVAEKEEAEEEEEDMTMNDLMDAIKQRQDAPQDEQQAKQIRDQVFANEEAFSSQYVESDEYKLYEEAISRGMKQGKFQQDDDPDDELNLALGELQEMIDAKKWDGLASAEPPTEEDNSLEENQDEEES